MFVQLEELVTQGEPGDWEIRVLITDFYSLMSKPFQLSSRFQGCEEHPGEKVPGFIRSLKTLASA